MKKLIVKLALPILLAAGCSSMPQDLYVPGLGEFMTQLSYRHGKLWFAGQAQNWELAAYELDEIQEGLEDVCRFHPSHNEVKAIPQQIARYMDTPIRQTSSAIKAKNNQAFIVGYEAITSGCNACHQANGFGFNVIVTPETNNYSNQQFKLENH